MNSSKCVVCNVDVHSRASYEKLLRSKDHLENLKQNKLIIPEWLYKEPIENKNKNIYNPEPLRQNARDNIRLDDEQLNKELAKKMLIPYYCTDRNLNVGFKINLDSHHINHADYKLTIKINFSEFGLEVRYIIKVVKELSIIYARLIDQFIFKYQKKISARFDKQMKNIN